MTKRPLFFAAVLITPFAIHAQNGWQATEAHANGFLSAQSGWFFTNPATPSKLEGQSGPVFGRPLSADEVRTTTQTLGDGTHLTHSETEHFYRDGQGRMRTETSTGAVIFDPVSGYTYDLTFARKTYTKHPNAPNASITIAAAAHQSSTSSSSGTSTGGTYTTSATHTSSTVTSSSGSGAGSGAGAGAGRFTSVSGYPTDSESLGNQVINGLNAKGSRVTVTIPQGAIGNDHELKVVNDRWVSDDYKLLLKTVNNDPRFGVSTYELQSIVQGEPSASLFQIPADYTEGH